VFFFFDVGGGVRRDDAESRDDDKQRRPEFAPASTHDAGSIWSPRGGRAQGQAA
jgi:hypothetical protein